jgi:hypothetical protein
LAAGAAIAFPSTSPRAFRPALDGGVPNASNSINSMIRSNFASIVIARLLLFRRFDYYLKGRQRPPCPLCQMVGTISVEHFASGMIQRVSYNFVFVVS